MSKATILDRLAGAMETLGKREGKALTPRQRVAAAQRFNELGSIGQSELASMAMDDPRYPEIHRRLNKMGLINNEEELQDNPFLSDNIDKYAEQDEFLDWCRYNRVEPNARSLKQFRWETYLLNSPGNVGTKYRTIDEFPDYLEPGEVLNLDYMWRY